MSTRLANTWIVLLIGLAACLVLTIALIYQGWSVSGQAAPIAANCGAINGCLIEPPPPGLPA